MMVAIQREMKRERKGDIYNTQIYSIQRDESNPIPFISKRIFFFFSFSPFYLLLNQRRTFFDSSV